MQLSEVRRAFVPFLRVRITVSVLVFSRSCRLGAYLPLANEIVSQCLHRFLCRTNINIRDFISTNTLFDFSGPREELLRGQRVEESESQTGGPRHRSQQEDECLRAGSTSFCNHQENRGGMSKQPRDRMKRLFKRNKQNVLTQCEVDVCCCESRMDLSDV